MEEEPVTYNAVPLPAALGTATVVEPTEEDDAVASGPQSAAQQRLAALKARMSSARGQNHKAVVAEDRRNKLGEDGLKAERVARAHKKKEQEGGGSSSAPTEAEQRMETTAEGAHKKLHAEEKKAKRRGEYGWDVFNNEAQYRHYKKQVRRTAADGRAAEGDEVVDEGDPDPLAYGQAPPVAKERVQALVEDMHEAALRRASWSRRRTFNEEKDVTYINKRNEVYNKKIERAFDPCAQLYRIITLPRAAAAILSSRAAPLPSFDRSLVESRASDTAEIRANLERGTAL